MPLVLKKLRAVFNFSQIRAHKRGNTVLLLNIFIKMKILTNFYSPGFSF